MILKKIMKIFLGKMYRILINDVILNDDNRKRFLELIIPKQFDGILKSSRII